MAAEYEVNIKLNTQQIERELGKVDKAVKSIGKAKGGSRASGLGLMPNDELKRLQQSKIYLGQSVQSIDRLAKIQDRRARSLNKINELESKGLNVVRLRRQLVKATTEQSRRRLGSAEKEFRILEKTLRLEESKLRILRQQQQGFAASPIRGTATMAGSPAQIAASARAGGPRSPIRGAANIAGSPEARRVRRQRLEQVGLGAGFPLLFGGGAGSVLGGAVGGLTGSFGAQIALSAIGQQIDQFVASMVDAGKALTSVGGAADFMAEKSLFSSDAMQFRIEKLIDEGQVTEAAALMTQEMAKQVGGSGLKALQDLGTEASKMGKLFNALILQVQAFISRALTPLLAAINKVVGDVVLNNQFNALMSEATGARAKEIEEFLKPFTKTARKGAAAKDVVTSEGKRLAVERFGGQVIPEGAAIAPTQLELLRAADVSKRKARKSRVPELQIEVSLTERLNALNRQVLEAKRAENPVREAALNMEIALEEQAAGIQKINNKKIPQEEKNLQIKKLELQTDQKIFEINDKLSASRAAQAEKNEKILADLQSQNDLLQAKLDGRLEEEEIEQRIRDLAEDNQGLDKKAVRNLLEKNKLLNEQIAAAEQLDQLYQSIGNTIANGVVNALEGAVMGTQSLADAASSMLNNLARQMLQIATNMALFGNMGGNFESGSGLFGTIAQGIISGLSGGTGGGGGGTTPPVTMPDSPALIAAKGAALSRNGVIPFARGGVVNRPTLFPFANGTGLMGEAGPEAIMPLRRGPGGRLGVEAAGGGGPTNIVVNVDASGSNVEGDSQQQKALGKAIGLAVQSEIARQKRPGGLLS